MSRNGSGTYSAPAGQPVVAGTVIDPAVQNTLVADLATEITDSLSRSGKGGMLAALKVLDGSQALPGMSFSSEPGSGFYRAGAADVRAAVTGTRVLRMTPTGIEASVVATFDEEIVALGPVHLTDPGPQEITKTGGAFVVGTTDEEDLTIRTHGLGRWTVNGTSGNLVSLDGQTITSLPNPVSGGDAANKTYADTKAPIASPTFTGVVTVAGSIVVPEPSGATNAATKAYVDALPSKATSWTNTQTFDGTHTVSGLPAPAADTDAATKLYVDGTTAAVGTVSASLTTPPGVFKRPGIAGFTNVGSTSVTGNINDAADNGLAASNLFTIPAGYRPSADLVVHVSWFDASAAGNSRMKVGHLFVMSSGPVRFHADGIAGGAVALAAGDLLYFGPISWAI